MRLPNSILEATAGGRSGPSFSAIFPVARGGTSKSLRQKNYFLTACVARYTVLFLGLCRKVHAASERSTRSFRAGECSCAPRSTEVTNREGDQQAQSPSHEQGERSLRAWGLALLAQGDSLRCGVAPPRRPRPLETGQPRVARTEDFPRIFREAPRGASSVPADKKSTDKTSRFPVGWHRMFTGFVFAERERKLVTIMGLTRGVICLA